MIIYCDIDGTLCETENMDYENAVAIQKNIDKLNKLHDNGNHVTIWTSRGYVSGKDLRKMTKYQLLIWGVKYDKLEMDKPPFDLMIDDKVLNVKDWKIKDRKGE